MTKTEAVQAAAQIPGWCDEAQLADLWELGYQASAVKGTFLEVGTWRGRSAFVLASVARRLICVDTWLGVPEHPQIAHYKDARLYDILAQAKVYLQPFLHKITFLQGDSRKILPELPDQMAGLVYVDGDHTGTTVLSDVAQGCRLLKPGGIICGDDYNEGGPQKALAVLQLPVIVNRGRFWWYKSPVPDEAAKTY